MSRNMNIPAFFSSNAEVPGIAFGIAPSLPDKPAKDLSANKQNRRRGKRAATSRAGGNPSRGPSNIPRLDAFHAALPQMHAPNHVLAVPAFNHRPSLNVPMPPVVGPSSHGSAPTPFNSQPPLAPPMPPMSGPSFYGSAAGPFNPHRLLASPVSPLLPSVGPSFDVPPFQPLGHDRDSNGFSSMHPAQQPQLNQPLKYSPLIEKFVPGTSGRSHVSVSANKQVTGEGQMPPEHQQPTSPQVKQPANLQKTNEVGNETASRKTIKAFDNDATTKRIEDTLGSANKLKTLMNAMEREFERERRHLQSTSTRSSAVRKLENTFALKKAAEMVLPMLQDLVDQLKDATWDDDVQRALAGLLDDMNLDPSEICRLEK